MISSFILHPGVNTIQPHPTVIHISAGEYQAEIILEELLTLPINNLRKLFRLLYADRNADNSEAIQMITDYLLKAITKAKDNLNVQRHLYVEGYRDLPKGYCREAAKNNKLLAAGVKKAKTTFERISKIQIIFQEIKNKEKKSCIKTTL